MAGELKETDNNSLKENEELSNAVEQKFDELDNALTKGEAFIESNSKNLLIGIGAIILLIFGVIYYIKGVKEPKNVEAAEVMFPAEQAFQRDSFQIALNGNSQVVGFLAISDTYSGTDAGNVANAYAGICYKKLGDNENAIKYLNAYSSSNSTLEPAIEGAIGDCYWDLQKEDDAIKAYNKAIKSDNKLVSPIYLRRLGLLYLKKGDKSNAKAQFEAIKEKYGESMQAQEADKLIAMCE
ncbi:MAG: tetratricopeptide repeat protein [Paludibacteraceae bacterium]|nr:tetratricopeptide repeat protein [Paludibacteraceae bacterium]